MLFRIEITINKRYGGSKVDLIQRLKDSINNICYHSNGAYKLESVKIVEKKPKSNKQKIK